MNEIPSRLELGRGYPAERREVTEFSDYGSHIIPTVYYNL